MPALADPASPMHGRVPARAATAQSPSGDNRVQRSPTASCGREQAQSREGGEIQRQGRSQEEASMMVMPTAAQVQEAAALGDFYRAAVPATATATATATVAGSSSRKSPKSRPGGASGSSGSSGGRRDTGRDVEGMQGAATEAGREMGARALVREWLDGDELKWFQFLLTDPVDSADHTGAFLMGDDGDGGDDGGYDDDFVPDDDDDGHGHRHGHGHGSPQKKNDGRFASLAWYDSQLQQQASHRQDAGTPPDPDRRTGTAGMVAGGTGADTGAVAVEREGKGVRPTRRLSRGHDDTAVVTVTAAPTATTTATKHPHPHPHPRTPTPTKARALGGEATGLGMGPDGLKKLVAKLVRNLTSRPQSPVQRLTPPHAFAGFPATASGTT